MRLIERYNIIMTVKHQHLHFITLSNMSVYKSCMCGPLQYFCQFVRSEVSRWELETRQTITRRPTDTYCFAGVLIISHLGANRPLTGGSSALIGNNNVLSLVYLPVTGLDLSGKVVSLQYAMQHITFSS